MVILFSNRKNKTEKEIIEILTACGADFISDKAVTASGGYFTVCSLYKTAKLNIKKGTVLILDDTDKFKDIKFESGLIGICEETNKTALEIFSENRIPVITCGNNQKNTLTISSFSEDSIIISLQRSVKTIFGYKIYQGDYNVKIEKNYSKNSILLSFAILLFNGIIPEKF